MTMFLALLAVLDVQSADPLAPARTGQLQCYRPDIAARTCVALSGYARNPDGSYRNPSEIPLPIAPLTTFKSVVRVVVHDGAVCGKITAADLDAGTFFRSGKPVSAAAARPLRDVLKRTMARLIGREVCTTYTPEEGGDQLIAQVTVDGNYVQAADAPVLWVSPSDGFRVTR